MNTRSETFRSETFSIKTDTISEIGEAFLDMSWKSMKNLPWCGDEYEPYEIILPEIDNKRLVFQATKEKTNDGYILIKLPFMEEI